jgi:hypothetical protein
LSVAISAFLIGIAGSTYWFFISVPSNSSDMQVYGEGIKITVTGRVLDNAGRPIRGAKVYASLGLGLEGPLVETDAAGHFKAEASSEIWFKVCRPHVQAYEENFERKVIHFDCSDWNEGERWFEQTVILEPKVNDNKP